MDWSGTLMETWEEASDSARSRVTAVVALTSIFAVVRLGLLLLNAKSSRSAQGYVKLSKVEVQVDTVVQDEKEAAVQGKKQSSPKSAFVQSIDAGIGLGLVLIASWIGNNWSNSYPRSENYNADMYGAVCLMLLLFSVCFREKLEDKRLLNRKVTDEWKGWMQVMFVMYHYTRAAFVYNEIRVFVSGYVWLTGFGNYMYFTKKKDFTVHRIVSTLIRINLLPFCLVLLNETDYSDYYVVPLHSIFFLLTMACCYVEHKTGSAKIAIFGTLAALMLCFEVDAISDLLFPNDEMHFRFGLDRYSTWYGIVCAHFLPKVQAFFDDVSSRTDTTSISKRSLVISVAALASSLFALWFWYYEWGFEEDKYVYNPFHPYIMIIPIVGYLVIRSFVSGWYLPILAWVGGITLETYVLQFHLIMCHNVNSILVIVEGYPFINLAVVVPIFLVVSWYARTFTMRVQTLAMKLFERLGLK